jgi:prephenate dehydrogenase
MGTERTIGLVGFGRFGRAFADLLTAAGWTVVAVDPDVQVPSEVAASDPADLARRSKVIVISTPIRLIGPALEQLAPHLTEEHTVFDVGSVKLRPTEEMQRVLGDRVPWAATHPLFGPMNVARGDRSLRAIVCPNPDHPRAVAAARELYEGIGCEVIEQTPEEHDRLMARTHAMAFFIAKGLIDTGADDTLPFSPPSFRALAQTIETVRSDAGHLYLAIQRDNPEAAAARVALMNALSRTHDEIERAPADEPPAASVSIGEHTGEPPAELIETRDLIDELDRELLRLLARRAALAGRAGSIKARRSRPVRDTAREDQLLQDRREWAAELGLSEDAIATVFAAILGFSRDAQG